MPDRRFGIVQETQRDPPRQPFAVGQCRALRLPMIAGKAIGDLVVAVFQRPPRQHGALVPPQIAVRQGWGRDVQQRDRLIVAILAAQITHPVVQDAQIVLLILR